MRLLKLCMLVVIGIVSMFALTGCHVFNGHNPFLPGASSYNGGSCSGGGFLGGPS